mgnify:CR=1 FL=1
MRTPAVVKGMKNSQKIRVIINGVGFYTTVRDTEDRFMQSQHRVAVQMTLDKMAKEKNSGLAQTIRFYDNQMKQISIDVQVDLM